MWYLLGLVITLILRKAWLFYLEHKELEKRYETLHHFVVDYHEHKSIKRANYKLKIQGKGNENRKTQ